MAAFVFIVAADMTIPDGARYIPDCAIVDLNGVINTAGNVIAHGASVRAMTDTMKMKIFTHCIAVVQLAHVLFAGLELQVSRLYWAWYKCVL